MGRLNYLDRCKGARDERLVSRGPEHSYILMMAIRSMAHHPNVEYLRIRRSPGSRSLTYEVTPEHGGGAGVGRLRWAAVCTPESPAKSSRRWTMSRGWSSACWTFGIAVVVAAAGHPLAAQGGPNADLTSDAPGQRGRTSFARGDPGIHGTDGSRWSPPVLVATDGAGDRPFWDRVGAAGRAAGLRRGAHMDDAGRGS